MFVIRIIIVSILGFFSFNSLMADTDSLTVLYFNQAESYRKNLQVDSAIISYKKAALRAQSIGNTEDIVIAYNQIGIMLTRLDQYEPALENLTHALSVGYPILEKNNLSLATSYISLGVVYSAMDNYEKSLENHFKALNIRLEKLGENHRDVATSYGNIGNVYLKAKDYQKAIDTHVKAMKIREKLFGSLSPETAQSYYHLGNSYKENKEYSKAIEYYEKHLSVKLTQNMPAKDLSKLYLNLSEVCRLAGSIEKEDLYRSKIID